MYFPFSGNCGSGVKRRLRLFADAIVAGVPLVLGYFPFSELRHGLVFQPVPFVNYWFALAAFRACAS